MTPEKTNRRSFLTQLAGVAALGSISLPFDAFSEFKRESTERELKNKWISDKKVLEPIMPEVDDFLKSIHGQIRLLYCKYDGAQLEKASEFNSEGLQINGNQWQSKLEVSAVKSDPTGIDLNVQVSLKTGKVRDSGIAVAFDFNKWSTDNYVMLPASVYNGNRMEITNRGYAEGLDRKYLYQQNIPLMSVPIPQLSPIKGAVSRLEVNTCNMATPAMCFFSKEKKRGFIVLTHQNTQSGDNGFIVEESEDRQKASLVISAPGVREKKPLFVGFAESTDRGANFEAGDQINLHLRLYSFEALSIPDLLEKFMEVRKSVTGPNNPRKLIPFSQVITWMTQRIDSRWFQGKEFQFYKPENADWISFGWIGGLMNTFPMIALGDGMHLERVTKTFDFAIPRGQGDAGYFYGALNHDGKTFGREGYDEFPEIVLTRKNADVLFWMIKQFKLLKAQGKANQIKPEWEHHIQRLADAFVKTWKENGEWGNFLNVINGKVAVYNTTSGAQAPGGLALAALYYDKPEYLKTAIKAANFYYQRDFVKTGQTTAHSADTLQNADADSAYAFAQSLMALYEVTRDAQWLEKSRQLCHLFSSWTTSFDYELPDHTELKKNGAKLTGIIWASTQNKHGAPGECTSSCDVLFKIYRATGEVRYAELLRDIIGAHGESIRTGGYTNERLTYCDAEPGSVGNRGNHITGWNELNGILMAMELPGIYLQADGNNFFVFDQVESEIVKRDNNGVTLKIKNPTAYEANVAIFAETTQQAKEPLGYTSFLNWPKIALGIGEVKVVRIENSKIIIN
ncbi:hypothetical protein [Pedobacter frigoris]|uniref:hypothetical protein n=1 Tax=Pedobacter frigoris TaxID=2571272 RepID=UPI0029319197|nr:hypothetical protein [Pedobacter frigoris]